MSLAIYYKKRNFKTTPEPKGEISKAEKSRFVVQKHQASRLHFDFRLEIGGVLKSWAVPKGPSMDSQDKRFAIMTEDHPVEYLTFKGNIPEGNYGAGKMEIWDKGQFFPVDQESNKITDKQAIQALKKGELKLLMKGKKIQGGFVLIKLKTDEKSRLLIKHKDEYVISSSKTMNKATKASSAKKPAKKIGW